MSTFHSYTIRMVHNIKTGQDGWRIVGLWGDEEKNEGNRVGPFFKEDELEQCEAAIQDLEAKYGLPVAIETIVSHFQPQEAATP